MAEGVQVRSQATGGRFWARPLGHNHFVIESGMSSSQPTEGFEYGDVVLATVDEHGVLVIREKVRVH